MERGVISLVKEVKSKLSIERTIYCGSSKGGWAALYYGIRDAGSTIIAGSLQYLMGNYVTRNERLRENLMKYVMGKDYTDDDIDYLNNLLRNTLKKNKDNNCDIHLHYSDSEYTYKDHMIHLLEDLRKLGIKFTEDIHTYKKHEELSLYFPPFLLQKVNEIINSK